MYDQYWELARKYKGQVALLIVGTLLLILGGAYFINKASSHSSDIEIVNTEEKDTNELVVEVSGSVASPGVFHLPSGSRIEDALTSAGGLTSDADNVWVERTLNRASKLTDGQKIYIPSLKEQSNVVSDKNSSGTSSTQGVVAGVSSDKVNINTASLEELVSLPGIGPVYGQNIIDHRPYSAVEELLTKAKLKKNVYEDNKDKFTIY